LPRLPQLTSGASQGINDAVSGLSHQADALRKTLCDGSTIVDLDKETMEAFLYLIDFKTTPQPTLTPYLKVFERMAKLFLL